jgi:hypothetical protein
MAALLKMLGSNNGIYSAIEGLWILMPAALLVIPRLARPVSSEAQLQGPDSACGRQIPVLYAGLALTVAVLAGAGAAGASIRYSNPYRDLPSRAALNTPTATPLLRRVYTSAARAESIGGLFEELARQTRPGDVVLAWDSVPMVHFVTRTIPALGTPWPDLLLDGDLRARMNLMWSDGGPVAIVVMKVDTRNRTWAVRDEPAPKRSGIDLDAECVVHGYTLAWQNAQFAVWLPPGK